MNAQNYSLQDYSLADCLIPNFPFSILPSEWRFFSRHRKSDSDRETFEETSDKSSSGESDSEPSSSAPLNPKEHVSSKQHKSEASAATKFHKVKSSSVSESLNNLMLGDPKESPLLTENETSDAEFIDICPLHRQPIWYSEP